MNLDQLIDDADRWRVALAPQIVQNNHQIGEPDLNRPDLNRPDLNRPNLNRPVQRSLQDAVFLATFPQRGLPGGVERA
jgi:hypothetical protein